MPRSIDFKEMPCWKRILSFLVQLVLFIILFALLVIIGQFLITSVLTIPAASILGKIPLHDWFLALSASFLTVFLLDRWQQKKGMATYGFSSKKIGKSLLLGLIVGSSILLISFGILLMGNWAKITHFDFQAGLFLAWALFFLIQPLAEEIIMRSFLQTQLHRHFGTHPGLFITALVFTLLHSANDNITLLASIQIFTGGYLMGLLYLQTKNIWATFAMHASWNFLQSTVFGFAVSGMETYSILKTETTGPDWLTGGAFGLEGSLLTLVLILLAITYYWKASKKTHPFGEQELENDPIALEDHFVEEQKSS